MLVSFTTLAITGLVQKYALSAISVFIVRLWGGIENLRATHHVAATVLMLVVIYHLVEIGYKVFVLRTRMTMLPGIQDVKDAWKAFLYNVGTGKVPAPIRTLRLRREGGVLGAGVGHHHHGPDGLHDVESPCDRRLPARRVHPRGQDSPWGGGGPGGPGDHRLAHVRGTPSGASTSPCGPGT